MSVFNLVESTYKGAFLRPETKRPGVKGDSSFECVLFRGTILVIVSVEGLHADTEQKVGKNRIEDLLEILLVNTRNFTDFSLLSALQKVFANSQAT